MSQPRVRFRSLWAAWLACRRRKRGTRDCLRYNGRLLDRLAAAQTALNACTWRPSRTRVFVTTKPKAREIHAPIFADRVVHHWLVPQLEVLYEPVFIHDSYANRQGKGTHSAVTRLQTFMRQATCNGQQRAYALQLDIANYFNTIDRRRLFAMISHRLDQSSRRYPSEEERYRHLARITRSLLTGNPAQGAYRLGHPARFDRVPPHKRLVNAAPECGLAIGNLSSQFFANVYLNELDQFVKHTLKCRWYLRYVDDFVLVDPDPKRLLAWRDAIEEFLRERLGLSLRTPVGMPWAVSRGVDFLGYVIRPNYLLVRQRVVDAADQCLAKWGSTLVGNHGLCMDLAQSKALQSSLGSYLGHFRHASGFRLTARLWARHPWLDALFPLAWPGIGSRLEPPFATSLASQHSWFTSRFPGAIVWLQVGTRWECYGRDALEMAKRYGFPVMRGGRASLGDTASIPGTAWKRWQKALARDGVAAVGAQQFGRASGHRHGLRRRVLSYVSPRAFSGADDSRCSAV